VQYGPPVCPICGEESRVVAYCLTRDEGPRAADGDPFPYHHHVVLKHRCTGPDAQHEFWSEGDITVTRSLKTPPDLTWVEGDIPEAGP
jgi:hypothetical protein